MLSKKDIVRGLKSLGVRRGTTLMVHSSYRSLGGVRGGPEAVIDALLAALGPSGTLVMPAFNFTGAVFHMDIPSKMGAITELFRRRKSVVRALHPTHSICAYGNNARRLVKDHLKTPTPCGKGTPFGRLYELGGSVLLLGVDQDRNTMLHVAEDYSDMPYLATGERPYIDARGRKRTVMQERSAGPHRDFIGIDRLLRETGVMKVGKIGNSVCRLMDARRMVDLVIGALAFDPALVLCDNPSCQGCLRQRGLLKARRLAQEDFKLAVSLPLREVTAENLLRYRDTQAINHIELDLRTGAASPGALSAVSRLLKKVGGVKLASANIGTRRRLAPAVRRSLKPACIIVAGSRPPEEKNILWENTSQHAGLLAAALEKREKNGLLAFNPMNFARLGEMPFLSVFTGASLGKHLGLLYFVDGTHGGKPALPVDGNGELKELLSILRCRSFPGYVVVRSPGRGIGLEECVQGFWKALDEI